MNQETSQPRLDAIVSQSVHWWLAEVGVHGYATELIDGPHDSREDVEQAMFMFWNLGLGKGKKYCCVRVEESAVQAKPHDTNMDALAICKNMIDKQSSG
jgi:hypothetical protein